MTKIKSLLARFGAWLVQDGKTTAIAAIYATAETLLAMPDFATMTMQDFLKRTVRITGVIAIGLFARDRKKLLPEAPKNVEV